MKLVLIIGIFSLAFVAVECFKRTFKISSEITRKLAHILGAGLAAFLPYFLDWHQIATVATLFVIVMLCSKQWHGFTSIHAVKRQTYGEVYLPLSVMVLALTIPQRVPFMIAMIILALADPAAHIFGNHSKGRKVHRRTQKTILGSGAFLGISFIVCMVGLQILTDSSELKIVVISTVVAVVTCAVELVSGYGTDNLSVPIVAAICLQLCK